MLLDYPYLDGVFAVFLRNPLKNLITDPSRLFMAVADPPAPMMATSDA